jgi:peptidoglycan/LPS O-acetylase OafA/YrhL
VTDRAAFAGSHPDADRDRAAFPILHLLRLLAAICIFAGHWCEPFYPTAFPQGQLAIDMFFMVEGFLAVRLLSTAMRPGDSARAVVLARIGHVYPIYLVGLIAGFAACWGLLLSHAEGWTPALLWQFLAAGAVLLPVQTEMVHNSVFPLNPPSWAIILELFGFAALALVRRASPRFGALLLWLAGTVVLLALAARWHDPNMGWRGEHYWGGIPRMIFGFFGGALLFSLHARLPGALRGGALAALAICAGFVGMQFLRIWLIAWPLVGIVTPLLVLAAARFAVPAGLGRVADWAGHHALAAYLLGYPIMIGWRLAVPRIGMSQSFAASPIGFALVLATILLAAEAWGRVARHIGGRAGRARPVRSAMSAA